MVKTPLERVEQISLYFLKNPTVFFNMRASENMPFFKCGGKIIKLVSSIPKGFGQEGKKRHIGHSGRQSTLLGGIFWGSSI